MKSIFRFIFLLFFIGTTCNIVSAQSLENYLVQNKLISSSGVLQNFENLNLEQLNQVSNVLEAEKLLEAQKDGKLVLDQYLTYFGYIKDWLGQYPGPRLKKIVSTRENYTQSYELAKNFTLSTKLNFDSITESGLSSNAQTANLQKLLSSLGEVTNPEISWRLDSTLNIPVLRAGESLIVFTNIQQNTIMGCVRDYKGLHYLGNFSIFNAEIKKQCVELKKSETVTKQQLLSRKVNTLIVKFKRKIKINNKKTVI